MGTSAPPLACCSRCCIADGRRLAIGAKGPFFRETVMGSAVHVAADSNMHSARATIMPWQPVMFARENDTSVWLHMGKHASRCSEH
jgi:photosystem II stability/assembly factor-like uncharacterized protein